MLCTQWKPRSEWGYKYRDCFCPISLQDGGGHQTCNKCSLCARHSTSWWWRHKGFQTWDQDQLEAQGICVTKHSFSFVLFIHCLRGTQWGKLTMLAGAGGEFPGSLWDKCSKKSRHRTFHGIWFRNNLFENILTNDLGRKTVQIWAKQVHHPRPKKFCKLEIYVTYLAVKPGPG